MSNNFDRYKSKKIKKILHNINSPLTTISGYAGLLQKKHNPEWAAIIKSETQRIIDMINELQGEFEDTGENDEK